MKKVWITALSANQPRVAAVSEVLKRYGLQTQGHFWIDEPGKVAWRAALDALLEARADAWLVLADDAEMAKPGVRYGLSLFAAGLREKRGARVPLLMLWNSPAPEPSALPQCLQSATLIEEAASSWAAKIVAKVNLPPQAAVAEYRFDVGGSEQLGQWFELGPREAAWDGVVFGVAGADAEIDFQAVGPAGALPEKTVLEYAQQGLKLQAGEREFTAWAVRNRVDAGSSYYARVKGCPQAVLFMPYAESGDAEAIIINLS